MEEEFVGVLIDDIEVPEEIPKFFRDNYVRMKKWQQSTKEKEWGLLGQPSGKFDYKVKYSAPSHAEIPLEQVTASGWDSYERRRRRRIIIIIIILMSVVHENICWLAQYITHTSRLALGFDCVCLSSQLTDVWGFCSFPSKNETHMHSEIPRPLIKKLTGSEFDYTTIYRKILFRI